MKAFARLLLVLALVAPAFASAQAQTPAPTCRLFASATVVNYNTKVKLDWSTKNVTSGYLTEVGAIGPNGSAFVVPGKNTTYVASFSGPGGTIICRVGIAVRSGGAGTGSGAVYGGGVVNIDGKIDIQGSSINTEVPVDANGNPINTGSSINTGNGVNTNGSTVNTNQPVNTTGSTINTNQPIDTNLQVNLNGTVNLGGSINLPTAQSVLPGTSAAGSGSGFSGGIVPAECRGTSTVANCDLCSLAQMGQNVANFLIGLTVPAAALLFAWAGILFFSSRGVPENINRAKKIFMTVVIGVVIALAAFMLVNTVMNMLIHGSDFGGWNWKTLNCQETRKARLYSMSFSQYLSSSLPSLSVPKASQSSTYGCKSNEDYAPDSNECIDKVTRATRQADLITTASATTGASGTDPNNRTLLSNNSVATVSSGNCATKSDPKCTSLDGVDTNLVNGVIQTNNAITTSLGTNANIVVSGGTEGSKCNPHCSSEQNNGTSVDIKFANSNLNSDAAAINQLAQAVAAQGSCLVWEPGPGLSCPSGITAKCITGTATGSHGSYYLNGNSNSCK